ncbi:MAG: histidine triad nucleotide-binding protein [Anaerolineae bacterium]
MIARFLFSVARSRLGELIIGWSFARMSFLIPVDRLYETERVVAFRHPKPGHPTHILIVPKQKIRSLLALTELDAPILQEVVLAAQHLVAELGLEAGGFRLVVNGGAYQDVMQIHWHLISDERSRHDPTTH